MNYEQRYKEALKAVKELQEINPSDDGIQNWINDKFPELAESEDERIRKNIKVALMSVEEELADFYSTHHTSQEEFLAWLEKQGSIDIDIESMVSSYKQRLKSQGQGNLENNPLINMCVSAFKQGVENTLEELNLKKL